MALVSADLNALLLTHMCLCHKSNYLATSYWGEEIKLPK